MKLITGTGLALLVAFAVGVFGEIAWLMVAAIPAVLAWSVISDRTSRRSAHSKWTRQT